jgi:hypothetical protein
MNELQIRLTADIKDIQSALTKVKKTLKDFEDSVSSSTDKSNDKFAKQTGIIQKLNADLAKYKTLITKATSEAEIAKYNAKLQETQKELARLNALGKVFEQRNVKVKEEIGLIGQLNAQVKQLKVSLRQATSEEEVARLNAQLEKTSAELARINSLGKTAAVSTAQSFDKFRVSAGAANGSAIAFNRVIQDAPFGIIGVGNNIQQLAEQFSALRISTGSTGAAVSTFFKSLFTGSNLLVLGISAATSAFTAYQLGLFDTKEETDEVVSETERFNQSLDNVVKSLNDVDSARLNSNKSAQDEIVGLELLNSVLNDTSKSESERIRAYNLLLEKYPRIITNISQEKALAEGLGDAYNVISSAIFQRASATAIEEKLVESAKQRLDLIQKEKNETSLQNELLARQAELRKIVADLTEPISRSSTRGSTESLRQFQAELALVNEQLSLLGNVVAPTTENALQENAATVSFLKNEYSGLSQTLISLLDPLEKVGKLTKRTVEVAPDIKLDRPDITGLGVKLPELDIKGNQGFIEQIQARIAAITALKDASRNLTDINDFTVQLDALQQRLAELNGDQVTENINIIADAFSSLGSGIAASLNIGDRALRGFVTTLLSATPKIIGAIIAQASARKAEAAAANAANAQVATGNAIVVATEGAKGLGPVGLALLPVFIAGALALVSSAFGKASSGGGSVSSGSGSTYTNRREFGGPVSKGRAYIVGEKRPELFVPNTNGVIVPQVPSMDYSGTSMSAGAMAIDVNIQGVSYGDDILFTVQQAQIRRGIR